MLAEKIHSKLYPHQLEDVPVMLERKKNFLAYEMGLGKTITSIYLSLVSGSKKTVVIGPALVKWNWYKELIEWGIDKDYISVLDTDNKYSVLVNSERFCIVNYESVPKHYDHLKDFDNIIIDESHYIKNARSSRGKWINRLLQENPDARVTFLSGTPIKNNITDLFNYLKISGHTLGKSRDNFYKNFVKTTGRRPGKGRVKGAKNIPRLKEEISDFMIRRKTEECIDLPELIKKKQYLKDWNRTKEYDKALMSLFQGGDKDSIKRNISSLNRITSISKVGYIAELAQSIIDKGEKVVIFSPYTEPINKLCEVFGDSSVVVTGSTPSKKREEAEKVFKEDDNKTVFLANLEAGGIGINLTNARNVIFTGFPFTPDLIEQPYKRCHRIGQTKPVIVHLPIAMGTIDEAVFDILERKSRDIEAIMNDDVELNETTETNIIDEIYENISRLHTVE